MEEDLEASISRALPTALKMPLYAAKKQNYEIRKHTLEGVESLCNNAALLKEYAGPEHIATLEATTKEFAMLDAQLAAYKAQLEKMERAIENGKLDPKELKKLVNACTKSPALSMNKNEHYKRFCESAGIAVEQDEDEDVVFQQSESSRSLICPVTQSEMERPLRNPSCGHTYSEQGIKSHLQHSKKCPVAGCPQRLTFNNLERDVEMEVIIERQRNASQQPRSHQHSSSVPSFRHDDGDEEEEEYEVE